MLLVVGLLTILAMLGGTFLIISHSHARSTASLTVKHRAEPVARGALERVCDLLKDDLHIGGGNWPYVNVGAGGAGPAERWRRFIDCPSDDIDAHLSSQANAVDSPPGRRLSDVFGTSTTFVDTDDDNAEDAYLIDTGISDVNGRTYHVAVNVVDLSGMLNVSICFDDDQVDTWDYPDYLAPVYIDLQNLIGERILGINAQRQGTAAGSEEPLGIHEQIALHPLSPTGGARPFSVGDEVLLRWLSSSAVVDTSRLYQGLTHNGAELTSAADRALMTTYNASRVVVRRPGTIGGQPFLRRLTLSDIRGSASARDALFGELVAAGAPRTDAAHFVANLWAYLSDYDTSEAFDYSYDHDGNPATLEKVVYGVIDGPVISEAFAMHNPDYNGDTVPGDWVWGAAVEIFNPTSRQISLNNYLFEGGSLGPLNITLAPGARCVLYNWDKETSTPATVADVFDPPPGSNWVQCNWITDFTESTKRLVRNATSVQVRVDSVSADELEYEATNVANDEAETKDARRDDGASRQRCAVAVYDRYEDGSHRLGVANNVDTSDMERDTCYEGFDVDVLHGDPYSLGQLTDIFVTGPDDDGNDLPHQLESSYATSASRGKLNWRSPDLGGGDYADVPWSTVVGELLEQIPGDDTREAPGPAPANTHTRVYGRVNINTAPREVLFRLPFPTYFDLNGNGVDDGSSEPNITTARRNTLCDYILAYRYAAHIGGSRDYMSRAGATGIAGLRGSSNHPGYMTPGELAVPLGDYVVDHFAGLANEGTANYAVAVNLLYTSVANVITTQSDTYAATIRVELRDADDDEQGTWHYLAVIDRGNCYGADDRPAVLLMTEVK
ncbi:MAG: hypothetical protein KGY99_05720 [Phycisphaerae bacterium]|nr:hypothetical protein [Phycisphaerae bacterium]